MDLSKSVRSLHQLTVCAAQAKSGAHTHRQKLKIYSASVKDARQSKLERERKREKLEIGSISASEHKQASKRKRARETKCLQLAKVR